MRFLARIPWIMRGWKVEDRGRGQVPPFSSPAPVPTTRYETLRFGVTYCPTCGEKVSVLADGVCRDCQPEDAA